MRLVLLLVLLLALAIPTAANSTPTLESIAGSAAAPAYLTTGLGVAVAVMPPVVAPVLGHLPSSALPHPSPSTCSVDRGDAPPATCSTNPLDEWVTCSAHYDTADRCSALDAGTVNNDSVSCSVYRELSSCSVLRAGIAQFPGLGATCSAIVDGAPPIALSCSVHVAGNAATCSVKNPTPDDGQVLGNFCSVKTLNQNPLAHQCSVLAGSTGIKRKCSVGRANLNPDNACSVFGLNSQCSVKVGTKGACTAFQGASQSACSVIFGGNNGCSVIGGSQGSFCTQP